MKIRRTRNFKFFVFYQFINSLEGLGMFFLSAGFAGMLRQVPVQSYAKELLLEL